MVMDDPIICDFVFLILEKNIRTFSSNIYIMIPGFSAYAKASTMSLTEEEFSKGAFESEV